MSDEKNKKIAVMTKNMDVEYASEILRGITQEAALHRCDISIFNAYVSADETLKHNVGQYNIYNLANLSEFDGVILFSNLIQGKNVYDSIVERLRESGIPVVCIDAPVEGFYCVGVENYQAMKSMVNHFIEQHHFTRISYISGQSFNSDSQLRLQAYCDAMREHGLPVDEKCIYPGSFSAQHGREVAEEMLQSAERLPQAVVCGNDDIAIGFSSVMRAHGYEIPEQIAVSGFDNTFEARNSVPRLTTVDRSLIKVGSAAVAKLFDHLEGRAPSLNELFPAVPVFGGSCGCGCEHGDSSGDINHFRRKYLKTVEDFERSLDESNMMIEDLNDSNGFEDFLKRLNRYVDVLECEKFYFCMDSELVEHLRKQDDWEKKLNEEPRTQGYAPVMSVPLAYEHGRIVDYEDFNTELMWPECSVPGRREGNHVRIVSPLHFRDKCQGYAIVEGSKFAFTSPFFKTCMINLSNGVENLRKRVNMENMLSKLDRLYVTDALTGLYNRFGFNRYTVDSFERCIQQQRKFMILFVDLDGLKAINDRYGHDSGDASLLTVAEALRGACLDKEICSRFGGDEYVVYAEGYGQEEAELFCDRFEALLLRSNEEQAQPYVVSASYGYEIFTPAVGDTITSCIEKADKRMYIQKRKKHGQTE